MMPLKKRTISRNLLKKVSAFSETHSKTSLAISFSVKKGARRLVEKLQKEKKRLNIVN